MERAMKIIEAMKRVKANKEKIADLQEKIAKASAHMSHETPLYPDPVAKIREWAQSCCDCGQENIRLLTAIARTNLATTATITLGDRSVIKPLAEWIWRRREYAAIDLATWSKMTDRGLQETRVQTSTQVPLELKLVRNYDAAERDKKIAEYRSEKHEIDAALEVVNAVTDLVEA
jgi:2-succinyl-5-enolpyruvyl-6-hydroxy-3-cyclohexene-1-carboxylate synthase